LFVKFVLCDTARGRTRTIEKSEPGKEDEKKKMQKTISKKN